MKKIKFAKENFTIILIALLSAILNFVNLGLEGTANSYYAAAVKSMTMSFKNFFFVSFDPASFVTIDKPPLGFWFQAISAKIFGFSGWSIILPQALAGVISVVIIYIIVKRSFGKTAGVISALCLAVTPVFVAVSRNNSVDNVLVLALLLACLAISIAAEKGKLKYAILSMALIGIGFNIKMLQAYMVVPAIYTTYLLTTAVSFKKRLVHLAAGTVVLAAVSLSWALIVDAIPASSRPYVDSSTNNTVMELITGHNGMERISLSGNSKQGMGEGIPGGNMQSSGGRNNMDGNKQDGNIGSNSSDNNKISGNSNNSSNNVNSTDTASSTTQQQGNGFSQQMNQSQNGDGNNFPGNPPSDGNAMRRDGDGQQGDGFMGAKDGGSRQGAGGMGGNSGLQGSFGGQVKSSITRLFSKNILSDQIVWFIPLAVFGFIAAAIREKLTFKLDNKRKQALALWFMWFLPVFVYFSYNTGTFHSYYLTMLAPPTAALAGIGITAMWEFYKEGGLKAWFLPAALIANGAVQLLMLYYFISYSGIIKVLMAMVIALCFGASILLAVSNFIKKKEETLKGNRRFKKALISMALAGLMVTPFVGSAAVLFTGLNSSFPAAGLELLSNINSQQPQLGTNKQESGNSVMIDYLLKNKTSSQKYLLVVSNASDAADIIINTGEPVMAIGGFLGSDKSITLEQFIELAKKGEVRYVMTGGMKGGGNGNAASEIMNWVQQNGTAVSTSEYSNITSTDSNNKEQSSDSNNSIQNRDGFGGGMGGQLYDLKAYTDNENEK